MASDTNNNVPLFIYIILHDISLICSLIISYPLYFSYFMFFFPYIINIISLISPYFIVAVFLSLVITTTTSLCPNLPQFELGLILQSVIQELKLSDPLDDNFDVENVDLEDFEVYRVVFEDPLLTMVCNQSVEDVKMVENDVVVDAEEERPISIVKKYPILDIGSRFKDDPPCTDKSFLEEIRENVGVKVSERCVIKVEEGQGLEKLFEELDKFEDFTREGEKAGEEKLPVVKKLVASENDKMSGNSGRWRSNSWSVLNSSHGSMREEEKEWRKTLACKLFEERHNSPLGGEEGMDSLWECYENNGNLNKQNEKSFDFHDDEDEYEDEVEMSNGHLCCLQALKLSTGKLNLGIKKHNLIKISKALKGFGWLHRVKNKHGNKS